MDKQRAALLVAFGGAAVLAWLAYWRHAKRKRAYGDLDGAVSFSSRQVAACRALEAEEETPLFEDPLAGLLAGPEAMRQAMAYAQELLQYNARGDGVGAASDRGAAGMPLPLGRKRPAGRLAVRTWWFDTQLQAALAAASAALLPGSGPPRRRQVVLLGAGMDTRAWRHSFLTDVAWFEVDRSDVLTAKDKALQAARAQPAADAAGAWKHPLRAASRVTLEVDLLSRSWLPELQAAGFDPQAPTVWIAEGLLMYLDETAVVGLLEETAAASAPGSALLTQALVKGYRMKEAGTLAAGGGGGNGTAEPGSIGALQQQFRWFCDQDPRPIFAAHGWTRPEVTSYSKMAAATGRPAEMFAKDVAEGSAQDHQCPFISATL